MREQFTIKTDTIVRNPRLERRIIEYNRESAAYMMLLIGAILVLIAVMY